MTKDDYEKYDRSLFHYGKKCGKPCSGLSKNGEMICTLENCRGCSYLPKKNKRFLDEGFWFSVLVGCVVAVAVYAFIVAAL